MRGAAGRAVEQALLTRTSPALASCIRQVKELVVVPWQRAVASRRHAGGSLAGCWSWSQSWQQPAWGPQRRGQARCRVMHGDHDESSCSCVCVMWLQWGLCVSFALAGWGRCAFEWLFVVLFWHGKVGCGSFVRNERTKRSNKPGPECHEFEACEFVCSTPISYPLHPSVTALPQEQPVAPASAVARPPHHRPRRCHSPCPLIASASPSWRALSWQLASPCAPPCAP